MSTHTHTDQSGTYTHTIEGNSYTVTYDGEDTTCKIVQTDNPTTNEIDFQEIDASLSLGDNEIVYNGQVYSLVWE